MFHLTKPRLRWYQYSLRTLLVSVAIFACLCSWFAIKMQRAQRQQEAVKAIRKAGGIVHYQLNTFDKDGNERLGEEPSGPILLQPLLGGDFFTTVFSVSFATDVSKFTDAELKLVRELPDLKHLLLDGTRITDRGLEHIQVLKKLEVLYLHGTCVTDFGLKYIHDLPRLRFLTLDNTNITGSGFRYFKELPQLKELSLDNTQVSDDVLSYLSSLPCPFGKRV